MDPFWVQVLEATFRKAEELGLDLISIDADLPLLPSGEEETALYEELIAQELDAVIGWGFPEDVGRRVLASGVPIVHLNETEIRHPLSVSPLGLYDIARLMGALVVEKLNGRGNVLAVGGLLMPGREDDGRSRVAGFHNALGHYPDVRFKHIPTQWTYQQVYEHVTAALEQLDWRPDAIFGLSDTIALAARDAGRTLRRVDGNTLIVGINGDPLALVAIAEGSMTATVETSTEDLGSQAAELAYQVAQGKPLPSHFGYKSRLVTTQNVAEVAAQKLIAMANLPTLLAGFNRQQQQERVRQLETSLEINRHVGSILDPHELSREIADLIRAKYGYDQVWFYRWLENEQRFELDESSPQQAHAATIPLERGGVLMQAVLRNQPLFIPDVRRSSRFPLDPAWPETRSRVVIPVRLSDKVVGVLDLHSHHSTQHARRELIGLQSLADQLGIGIRNAELYSEAVEAKAAAEKADQLKTRLLANVSHELRTPLDIIIGCSQSPRAAEEAGDRQHIRHSAEHLKRLINDLLDLSRAEVNELDLAPEMIDPRWLLQDVFHSVADKAGEGSAVAWQLQIPERLPAIQADVVRLRQILLNLLSNARKFTDQGSIVLGAETAPPYLHMWVADTGAGIPAELQERIFEPFVTAEQTKRRGEGIGLGLSITRRLVALHHGTMTLDSQPGRGSTFHVYLPLPTLDSQLPTPAFASPSILLLISSHEQPAPEIIEMAARQGLQISRLVPGDDVDKAIARGEPAAIAWDCVNAGPEERALAETLRAHPKLSHLPFVFYAGERSMPTTSAPGLTSVVLKPVYGQTLLETIRALCPAQAQGPVLIVDDDPRAVELYKSMATKALPDYAVHTVRDGAEALKQIAEETPSVVLLDLTMPYVDGFQVLDSLRANPQTRRVPVLVLSGRVLTSEDIKRLEQHALVTLQSKDILSEGETADALRHVLSGVETLSPPTSALVKKTVAYLQQNYPRALTRQEIAQAIGVTENYLSRIFRQELGLSPWDYLNRYRIKQAKELLRQTNESVTSIALQVGFDNPAYFSRIFHKQVGRAPSQYRDNPT